MLKRLKQYALLLTGLVLFGAVFCSTQAIAVAATDDAVIQSQLAALRQANNQTGRVVQVDLAQLVKISQYTDIDSSALGYGKNACGLVAAAAAVGGSNWEPLVGRIAKAAGPNYGRDAGIQPSKYVAALQQVFGAENVGAQNASTLEALYQELQAGNLVIVDLKVSAVMEFPSAYSPNYAHFARVLGIDVGKRQIYVQNTLSGSSYWTLSLDAFLRAWERPETTASIVPDPANAENVTRWAVVLNDALLTSPQA